MIQVVCSRNVMNLRLAHLTICGQLIISDYPRITHDMYLLVTEHRSSPKHWEVFRLRVDRLWTKRKPGWVVHHGF